MARFTPRTQQREMRSAWWDNPVCNRVFPALLCTYSLVSLSLSPLSALHRYIFEWVAVLFTEPTATELALPYRPPCERAHARSWARACTRSQRHQGSTPRQDRPCRVASSQHLESGKASEEAWGVLTVSNKIAPAAPKRRARGGKASRARRLENFRQHKAAAPVAAPAIKWEQLAHGLLRQQRATLRDGARAAWVQSADGERGGNK